MKRTTTFASRARWNDEHQSRDETTTGDPCEAPWGSEDQVQPAGANEVAAAASPQSEEPDGGFSPYFTHEGAWEFIADKLEAGHAVDVVELRKPQGAKGYVMNFRLGPDDPLLYVKLQLGSGTVIGRSFHYSDRS